MTNTTKTAIFTMGLPGAGKSTVCAQKFPGVDMIDPDAVKEGHADYDAKNPAALHVWSKAVTAEMFADKLAGTEDFILDGTGTNVEVLVSNIRKAKVAGFETTLLYVTVSLETALDRNSKRDRIVPEAIVREKAELIHVAMEIAAKEVDKVDITWNE